MSKRTAELTAAKEAKRARPALVPLTNQADAGGDDDEEEDAAFADEPRRLCSCASIKRKGWTAANLHEWPVGVHEVAAAGCGGKRFHASFGAAAGRRHLGCFATAGEASTAWDDTARRLGWSHVNTPCRPGESAAALHLERLSERAGRQGFPFVSTDAAWRAQQLDSLLQAASAGEAWAAPEQLLQHDHWNAPGSMLCLSYQPHIFSTRKARACHAGWQAAPSKASATEWYAASATNRARAVRSVLERWGEETPQEATLRREVCFLSGAWVLNFQPLLAAAIYRRYGRPSGTVVYDPCAGWGGRLLGAAAAGNVSAYCACEPSSATFSGLEALSSLVATRRPGLSVRLMRRCAEDTRLPASSVDIVFTSPPYFCLELYSAEPTQSHLKYPEPSWWLEQFLGRLCAHSFAALRPGGALLLNIANNRMLLEGGCDLEAGTCAHAERAGFTHEATLRMLKPRLGVADERGAEQGSEPIFVFRKPPATQAVAQQAPAAVGQMPAGLDEGDHALGELLGGW